jgi:hypothetical protein
LLKCFKVFFTDKRRRGREGSYPVLATWFIRPELSGKRGLSWYFDLVVENALLRQ